MRKYITDLLWDKMAKCTFVERKMDWLEVFSKRIRSAEGSRPVPEEKSYFALGELFHCVYCLIMVETLERDPVCLKDNVASMNLATLVGRTSREDLLHSDRIGHVGSSQQLHAESRWSLVKIHNLYTNC